MTRRATRQAKAVCSPDALRRQRLLTAGLSLLAVLAAAGGGVAASRTLQSSRGVGLELGGSAGCPAAGAVSAGGPPKSLGSWPFRLVAKGTFTEHLAEAAGRLLALQARGSEERSLPLAELAPSGRLLHTSKKLEGAALLASSAASSGGRLFAGAGFLSLGHAPAGEPYRLYPYLLGSRLGLDRRLWGYSLEPTAPGHEAGL